MIFDQNGNVGASPDSDSMGESESRLYSCGLGPYSDSTSVDSDSSAVDSDSGLAGGLGLSESR